MEKIEKTLAKALVSAMAEIGAAVKNSTNPHYKSGYADLAAVVETVKPALTKNGLAFIQKPMATAPGFVGIETVILHETGEAFAAGEMVMPLAQNTPQAYGSLVTYIRRYSLAAIFGVPQVDDDANSATIAPPAKSTAPAAPKPKAKVTMHRYNLFKLSNEEQLHWAGKFTAKGIKQNANGDYLIPKHVDKLQAECYVGDIEVEEA